jgi:hypothetical protein
MATQWRTVFVRCGHGGDQRQEGEVEEQHLVFGVVGDVGDLVGVQARVDGVQHRARARHRVVQLHVAVAVPGQRGHAVAHLDAQTRQRVGHAARTRGQFLVGGAVDVAFDPARHDLAFGVVPFGVNDEGRNQQRLLHHLAKHGVSCGRARWPAFWRMARACGVAWVAAQPRRIKGTAGRTAGPRPAAPRGGAAAG